MTTVNPHVSVLMPFLNAERFLAEAVKSVLAQSYQNWELLLIDDGSSDASTQMAHTWAEQHPERIRYLEHDGHANRGISASQNLGIAHARGEYVAFLDSDDVWLPHKLEQQVPLLDARDEAGLVCGSTLWWYSWTGDPEDEGRDFIAPIGTPCNTLVEPPKLLTLCLQERADIPLPSSVLVRRRLVEEVGGFEEDFRFVFTDRPFFTKLLLVGAAYVTDGCWTKYRRHPHSSCSMARRSGEIDVAGEAYLIWARKYLEDRHLLDTDVGRALQAEIRASDHPRLHRLKRRARSLKEYVRRRRRKIAYRVMPPALRRHATTGEMQPVPAVGKVDFGALRRASPIGFAFGYNRGQPIDRYYVRTFISENTDRIRGRVLEIGTRRSSSALRNEKMSASETTDRVVERIRAARDAADLTEFETESFDCVLLDGPPPGNLDPRESIRELHRIVKPDGVLLAALPGISQYGEGEQSNSWSWGFTPVAARQILEGAFGPGNVEVRARGNVLAASAFLFGLAAEELTPEELDRHNPSFPVVVTACAKKVAGE